MTAAAGSLQRAKSRRLDRPARLSVRRGQSLAIDPIVAARELHAAIWQPDIGFAMFFCSSRYDLGALGAALAELFAGVELIGCTTAGEIGQSGYVDRSISGFSIGAADCVAATECIRNVSEFDFGHGQRVVDSAVATLHRRDPRASGGNTFGLMLIDGLCHKEDVVTSVIHSALGNVPLVGGSAGDDLGFTGTFVYFEGRFHADAAVLALCSIRRPFTLFKRQNLTVGTEKMVVSEADSAMRIVREINAEPATREYARVFGLRPEDLHVATFAECPVVVRVGGEYYVRSILEANENGSLTFACAIDAGVVLTAARSNDFVGDLQELFAEVREAVGQPELVIGFDCVYRSIAMEKQQVRHRAGTIMAKHNVVGFSTYGEQYNGSHVNLTFTGIAIGGGDPKC